MSEARVCGGCTACCKLMEVTELQKPMGRWCQHCAIGEGCKIYEERPESCRGFRCAWLDNVGGFFKETDRPDKLKVMFSPVESPFVTAPEGVWRAFELNPNAHEQPRTLAMIIALVRQERCVMVYLHGGKKADYRPAGGRGITPEGKVAELVALSHRQAKKPQSPS